MTGFLDLRIYYKKIRNFTDSPEKHIKTYVINFDVNLTRHKIVIEVLSVGFENIYITSPNYVFGKILNAQTH